MTTIRLPYPVSANRYWRNMRGRMIRSAEANSYRSAVAGIARKAEIRPLAGFVELGMTYHPKTTKKGAASRVRLDLDNCIKVVLDALNSVAYADDKQVIKLWAEIGQPIDGGGLTVWVLEIAKC